MTVSFKRVYERFSEIRVKNYSVLTAYLLTGARDPVVDRWNRDRTVCHTCHRPLTGESPYYEDLQCDQCVDAARAESKERRRSEAQSMRAAAQARFPMLRTMRDTSLGL
jgi:hypothetical protein